MKIEDFVLKSDKDSIPWRLFSPDGSRNDYCILWIQGWTSSMDSHKAGVERMSNKTGIAFATLDYAGHGLHKLPLEESTRKQQHEATIAVFDELKEHGFEKIIVIGGSFGGYMTALLTGKRPVHAAVLRAPAMYADDEFDIPHKQTRRWQNSDAYQQQKAKDAFIDNNEAVRSIRNYKGFTYILEHELDEQVPRVMPMTYFENAQHGNYTIIPNTMHSPKLMKNPQPHFEYIEHVVIGIIEAVQLQTTLSPT